MLKNVIMFWFQLRWSYKPMTLNLCYFFDFIENAVVAVYGSTLANNSKEITLLSSKIIVCF